jgi:hypothetical protein
MTRIPERDGDMRNKGVPWGWFLVLLLLPVIAGSVRVVEARKMVELTVPSCG